MIELYASPNGNGDGTQNSPFSFVAAKQRVQQLSGTDNIRVWLWGGLYQFLEPVIFGPDDSGKNGFTNIWIARPGERPVFSGAYKVENWTQVPGKTWMYQADVPVGSDFRNLEVNGIRADRTALDIDVDGFNSVYCDHTLKEFGVDFESFASPWDTFDFRTCINKQDIEMHCSWYRWGEARFKASGTMEKVSLDGGINWRYRLKGFGPTWEFLDSPYLAEYQTYGYELRTEAPTMYSLMTEPYYSGFGYPDGDRWAAFPGQFLRLENIFELLTINTKGYFYLNKRLAQPKVYYVPRVGEDIHSAIVYAPQVDNLLLIDGAENITFVGVDITNCGGILLNKLMFYEGQTYSPQYWHEATDLNPGYPMQAAIEIRYSSNIHFIQLNATHCDVVALFFGWGAKNCSISGGDFKDLGGSAIWNGHEYWLTRIYDESSSSTPTDPEDWWRVIIKNDAMRNRQNRISSNKVHDVPPGWPIAVCNAEEALVEHNEVYNTGNLAIVCRSNFCGRYFPFNHLLRKNLVHDVMLTALDGGALYASGAQIGLKYLENVVYNVSTHASHTLLFPIYFDDNGCGLTAEKNVILPNINNGPSNWGMTKNYDANWFSSGDTGRLPDPWGDPGLSTLYPNKVINNYHHQGMQLVGSAPVTSGNTAINGSNPASWPSEVTRIVNEAGPKLLEASEIIDGELVIYGWRSSAGETISLSTTSGEIVDYEERDNLSWRARVVGIDTEDFTIIANGKSLNFGNVPLIKNPIFRGDGSRAGNILKGDGSKGGIVMKNNGGTWSPN